MALTKNKIDEIIAINKARNAELFSFYDPVSGEGSPIPRTKINFKVYEDDEEDMCIYFPNRMIETIPAVNILMETPCIETIIKSIYGSSNDDLINQFLDGITDDRLDHDFEFWAFVSAKIQDKETKVEIPFRLNKPQRKMLSTLESMRLSGIPIRIILLKARQWGGSTLVQVYMAWMQIRRRRNWHSAIIADVEDQARNIRNMYTRLASKYPEELGALTFAPFEGSAKVRIIKERNCIVNVGSAQKPEALRSFDIAMCHLSEVGMWRTTAQRSGEDLAQAIRAAVPDIADTLIVMESTAKGVGNFFHREWEDAESRKSSYVPVFVPWFEIERYHTDIEDIEAFINTMGEYEWNLFELGATLEGINWYIRFRANENYDDWRMKSEFPSFPQEAFQSTGHRAFAPQYILNLRKGVMRPKYIGDLYAKGTTGAESLIDIRFENLDQGHLYIWELPDKAIAVSNRYALFADIGGRTDKADWSVIRVIDRYWMVDGGQPVTVATWRGHMDQDMFAWKAAQLAKFYNNGLLALETNSLDTTQSEGDHFLTVLNEIVNFYPNLYYRTDPEKVRQGLPVQWGFHTNIKTKAMIIDTLNGAARDYIKGGGYIERDVRVCDEMDSYEIKPNGKYGAVVGKHDDLVMATAGCVWMAMFYMDTPRVMKEVVFDEHGNIVGQKRQTQIINEASI